MLLGGALTPPILSRRATPSTRFKLSRRLLFAKAGNSERSKPLETPGVISERPAGDANYNLEINFTLRKPYENHLEHYMFQILVGLLCEWMYVITS